MPENTDTSTNTTNGTVAVDADEYAVLRELLRKEQFKAQKAQEAKELRKRQNNRPLTADGKEMSAGNGWLTVLHEVLVDWQRVYANDPEAFVRRFGEHIVPMTDRLGSTPSTAMAGAYDENRRVLESLKFRPGTDPVPAPKSAK